jgi:hypothetical protein
MKKVRPFLPILKQNSIFLLIHINGLPLTKKIIDLAVEKAMRHHKKLIIKKLAGIFYEVGSGSGLC